MRSVVTDGREPAENTGRSCVGAPDPERHVTPVVADGVTHRAEAGALPSASRTSHWWHRPLAGATGITGDRPTTTTLQFPEETPQNHIAGNPNIVRELFLVDGQNLLQLTNFRRVDTRPVQLDADRRRVIFEASANPRELHDSNPNENCQLFSIDRTGSDLRQLTSFDEGGRSVNGCDFNPGRGCGILFAAQDPLTQTIVFYSSCDPLGTNPQGGQLFAMRPDGNGLRQLTAARGTFTAADGISHVELPGPSAYGPYQVFR